MARPPDTPPGWWRLAAHPATVRRALLTALVVGTVLIVINHGDALLRGEISLARAVRMTLTVAVPYLVSTVSSVATRRELAASAQRASTPRDDFKIQQ